MTFMMLMLSVSKNIFAISFTYSVAYYNYLFNVHLVGVYKPFYSN